MMCRSRDPSPVGSEISVGSPSPPPSPQNHHKGEKYFQPLKRIRMSSSEGNENHNKNISEDETSQQLSKSTTVTSTTKQTESGSGKRSFNIADILGQSDSNNKRSKNIVRDTIVNGLSQLHQQQQQLSQVAKIVRPWDHLQQYPAISIRPSLLPPALLHYEQRLAMEYHQQLQEHFHAQAQLLRHMNLASQHHPHDIIPSESGSDRSSSVASDCCSPDITGRSSENSSASRQQIQQKSSNNNNNNKSPNGTPLDALFQLSNKNFDEANEEGELANKNPIKVPLSQNIN